MNRCEGDPRRGHDVLQIDADASVFDAVKRMVEAGVGSLLVTEGGEDRRNLHRTQDYLRRMTLEGRDDKETAVSVVMSSPLVVVTHEEHDRRVHGDDDRPADRHLPVVEGEVAGIVSIRDIVKFKSKRQSFEIKYLTDYITAR